MTHGLIMAVLCALLAFSPGRAAAVLRAFPRSVWPGRALVVADTVWFAAVLLGTGMNWIDAHRPLVMLLAVVLCLGIVFFMPELLSVRAFGTLLLLAANPIIEAAFMHPAGSRLVMTTYAYALAIIGCVLVWSPYLFRRWLRPLVENPGASRAAGAAGAIAGLCLAALGLFAY